MEAQIERAGHRGFARTTARLAVWTLVWLATIALAKFGPGFLWNPEQVVVSWGAVVLNVGVGVGVAWIVAFTHYLRGLDELHRKLMLDALAITLGVGWVAGFAYAIGAAVGLVSHEVSLVAVPVLLVAVYLVAVAIGKLRYR
jgi:hypothetical protein